MHVNLEGAEDEALMRYGACLSGLETQAIDDDMLTPKQKEKLYKTLEEYDDRLMILNMTNFGVTIQDLVSTCKEVYKDFKFDLCIIDYGQLLKSADGGEYRLQQADVYRGLTVMSKMFDCVVISPAQATRGAQEEQESFSNKSRRPGDSAPILRSSDISESFEIARVSGVILSLNITDEEREANKLRVFLEKQRHGRKGIQYGLYTEFGKANLITGKFYNPYSSVESIDTNEDGMENTIKLPDSNPNSPKIVKIESLQDLVTKKKKDDNLQEQIDILHKSVVEINSIITEMDSTQEEIHKRNSDNPFEGADPESITSQLKVKLDNMQTKTNQLITQSQELFEKIFPEAKREDLIYIKEQIEKCEETKNENDKVEYTKILEIFQFNLG